MAIRSMDGVFAALRGCVTGSGTITPQVVLPPRTVGDAAPPDRAVSPCFCATSEFAVVPVAVLWSYHACFASYWSRFMFCSPDITNAHPDKLRGELRKPVPLANIGGEPNSLAATPSARMCGGGKGHLRASRFWFTNTGTGDPASIRNDVIRLAPWLCAPAFRRVCQLSA